MKNIRETLPSEKRKAVAALLQDAVVDFADLALQAKQAHWALVGPNFKDLHEEMDVLNSTYLEAKDEIAERMLALGHLPQGQVGYIIKNTTLPVFPDGFTADTQVITLMADRVATVTRRLRER